MLKVCVFVYFNRDDNRVSLQTALHLSAEHGHVNNVRVLLDAGASFVVKDRNGLTAMDLADRSGHEACVNLLKEAAGEWSFGLFILDFGKHEGLRVVVLEDAIRQGFIMHQWG